MTENIDIPSYSVIERFYCTFVMSNCIKLSSFGYINCIFKYSTYQINDIGTYTLNSIIQYKYLNS